MVSIGQVGLILGNNGNIYLSNFRRNEATNLKEAVVVNQKYTLRGDKRYADCWKFVKSTEFLGIIDIWDVSERSVRVDQWKGDLSC